jgi:ABC-type Fe3+/spermidine/putrescine transport system ATPase subunit
VLRPSVVVRYIYGEITIDDATALEEVFERPTSPFVARFTGANVLPGSLVGGSTDRFVVRPEHVRLRPADPGDETAIRATAWPSTSRRSDA